jgi:hypothetical protein
VAGAAPDRVGSVTALPGRSAAACRTAKRLRHQLRVLRRKTSRQRRSPRQGCIDVTFSAVWCTSTGELHEHICAPYALAGCVLADGAAARGPDRRAQEYVPGEHPRWFAAHLRFVADEVIPWVIDQAGATIEPWVAAGSQRRRLGSGGRAAPPAGVRPGGRLQRRPRPPAGQRRGPHRRGAPLPGRGHLGAGLPAHNPPVRAAPAARHGTSPQLTRHATVSAPYGVPLDDGLQCAVACSPSPAEVSCGLVVRLPGAAPQPRAGPALLPARRRPRRPRSWRYATSWRCCAASTHDHAGGQRTGCCSRR